LGRGTGLGLATVHGVVEQSGGRIHIESEPGAGTKFILLFPRCAERPEAVRPESPSASRGHETILLVEDEASVRALTTEVLSEAGYAVLAAEDGAGAVRIASTHPGPIDLLVTDMSLRGPTGSAIAGMVRSILPG